MAKVLESKEDEETNRKKERGAGWRGLALQTVTKSDEEWHGEA